MSTFQGSRAASENLAIATGYGIHDREFHKALGSKVPKHRALSIFRELEGKMKPIEKTRRHEYYFYEEGDHLNTSITIESYTGSAATITITLEEADHYDSGTKSYPIVGQLAVFENETVGYVSATNKTVDDAHTVTLKRLRSTDDLDAAAVNGAAVSFYGNVQKEASTSTDSRVPVITKVTNKIHTAREKYDVTDFAAQNEVEFEYDGQKFLYVKGIADTVDRFSFEEEMNLIISPMSSGLTDASSNALQTAAGLIPQVTDNGQNYEYDDQPDMATFDDIVLVLDDNYGDTEYIIGQGKNLALGMKNFLNEFSDGGDNNVSFNYFDGGEKQALNFNFVGINICDVDFYLSTWDCFTHRGSLGAGDMPYRHMGIFIPCGSTKNPDTNEQVPYMQLRYSPPQGAAHEVQGDIKVWETGANAKKGATSDELKREIHIVSYKSLEIRNREKFLKMKKSA